MRTKSIDKISFINLLKEKNIAFFKAYELKKIFRIENDNTLRHLLVRLHKTNVVKRLMRNKYQFVYAKNIPSDYAIANFLISPSYISLETALSYYGFLEQFPYRITSIIQAKSRQIKIQEKTYAFSQIKNNYFKDYTKLDDFLIATKEKALFDYLYFTYKGLRPIKFISDILFFVKDSKFRSYLKNTADERFFRFVKKYVEL